MLKPTAPKPSSIIAQLAGSGTEPCGVGVRKALRIVEHDEIHAFGSEIEKPENRDVARRTVNIPEVRADDRLTEQRLTKMQLVAVQEHAGRKCVEVSVESEITVEGCDGVRLIDEIRRTVVQKIAAEISRTTDGVRAR